MVVKAKKCCQPPSPSKQTVLPFQELGYSHFLPSFSMAPPRSTLLNGRKVAYQERKILAS